MLLLSRASTICNLLINWELSHKSHHQCTVVTKYINDIDIFNIQLDIDRIWEVGILRMRILSLLHDGFLARMLTLGLYTLSATLQIPPKAVFIFQRGNITDGEGVQSSFRVEFLPNLEFQAISARGEDELLPVSLLCGFLGAGKTTLLKHILETKHAEKDFRCAVIVNDMAALNIDKSLIDQSALLQSDEVIAMQNGCFCCTLQSDLVDQIISLVEKNLFNYMLIEASGVSEPSQIAPLFDLCDDEHDPDNPLVDHDHDKPQLGEVARLDTCITVVDSAEFYNNLESMRTYENGESIGTIAELMMEQVEFSNVVVVNKIDLVSEDQKSDIIEKIGVLNPSAKVIESIQSKVKASEILDTRLYKASDQV